jgi:hypothetical protein
MPTLPGSKMSNGVGHTLTPAPIREHSIRSPLPVTAPDPML